MPKLIPQIKVVAAQITSRFGGLVTQTRPPISPAEPTSNPDGSINGTGATGFNFYGGGVFVDPPVAGVLGVYVPGIALTGVTPGAYTTANVTVNAYGQVTAISNGPAGAGALTEITGGTIDYSLTSSYAAVKGAGAAPMQITLAAGDYLLGFNIALIAGGTANDDYRLKIRDITNSVDITERRLGSLPASLEGNVYLSARVKPTGSTTYALYAENVTASRGSISAARSQMEAFSASSSITYPLPSIASFTPSGGTSVSVAITGTGFTGATSVQFNGVSGTSITVVSDTSITVTSPSSFSDGPITVTTPGGTASSVAAFTSSVTSYNSTILAEASLTHYYKLDEASGTILDSKGSVNGTATSVLYAQTGVVNDGSTGIFIGRAGGQNITLASCIGTGNDVYSFDCWIKPNIGNYGGLCQISDTPYSIYELDISGGMYPYNGGVGTTYGSLSSGTGYHIGFSNDGTNCKFYINGVLQGTNSGFDMTATSGSSIIGSNAFSQGFNGLIQKFAFYNTALSASVFLAHYNAGH